MNILYYNLSCEYMSHCQNEVILSKNSQPASQAPLSLFGNVYIGLEVLANSSSRPLTSSLIIEISYKMIATFLTN